MRILSIGDFSNYGSSNTCTHRNWALKRIGIVDEVDTYIRGKRLLYRIIKRLYVNLHIPIRYNNPRININIVNKCYNNKYDIIWIDKGIFILKETFKRIKELQPNCKIVGYSPDNMVERHNWTKNFIDSLPYYDFYITTKSYNVQDLIHMGCKNVLFVNNAYEDTFHHPYNLIKEETKKLGGKIGFIGAWEKERCESIIFLAKNSIPVRVWGGGKWLKYKGLYPSLTIEDDGLFSEDYNKALSAFDISLCFLRKINKDLQTTRTMEIPACGSMLLAEWTTEHAQLFENGKEAVFFEDNESLLKACQYYIEHEDERQDIAESGRRKCLESGYSNYETIKSAIKLIMQQDENPIH